MQLDIAALCNAGQHCFILIFSTLHVTGTFRTDGWVPLLQTAHECNATAFRVP